MKKRLFNQQSEPGSREAATAQRLSVKARIMMALFALMLIPQGAWAQGAAGNSYNLWIGGTQVTDANKGAILSPDRGDSVKVINSAETWSLEFDSERSALILKNIEIQREIRSGLDNLTIRFEGTNKINSDTQSNDYVAASSAHANSLSTYDPATPANPHSSATLTFQKSGNGSLELDGRDTYSAVKGFASVSYGDGCYLKADKPTKYSSDDKCYINFANGNAPVDVVTISTDVYYPLWIGTSTTAATQVTTTAITTGVTAGTVTFTPAIGTTSSKLSLSGATLNAKILSALGNLVIDVTGKNTITSPDSGTVIRSVNEGTLTLERAASIASLELKTNLTDNTKPVIQGFHTLSYNTSFDLNTSATTPTYGIFYSMYGLFDDGPGGIFAIMQATFAKNYGLSIAGTPVTSANAGNVFSGDATNDGKVTFLPDATTANSGKLTLNGFEKTDADAAIVSGLDNLTIEFSGANEIGATSGWDGFVKSTNTNATLTFKGGAANSTLVLHGSDTTNDAVVEGFKSVSYDGAYWNYSDPITYDATTRQYRSQNSRDNFMLNYVVITTTPQYLLWLGATQVSDDNKDNILNDADNMASYNVTDNILTLDDCDFHSMNGLMCGLNSLTISLKGSNTIAADYYSNYSALYSSVSTATLNIQRADGENNCSLVLGTMGNTPVVKGFASVSYPDLDLNVTDGTGTTIDAATTYGAKLSVSAYPLWIGNTQVNVANAGNVLSGTANDGKVSYVHDATNNTGTLTLNGATLSGDISTSMSDLTIHVKGNNKISAASNCIRSSATTPGKLTFTKDTGGKLELDNASNHYSVIKGFNDVDGVPLETKAPYEIYINGDYYRLKQLFVAAGDTASIDYAWVYADTTYPIWVDGHQATSVSANNILGDAGSTASFNSNTLTLDDATILGAIVSSLTSTLTISVKGNSTVSGGVFQTSNATADLVVSKDATATGNVSLLVNPGREAAIRGFSSFTYTDFVPFNSSRTTDLSDGISYDNSKALKYNGTALGAVYLLSKTDLATAGLTFTMASVAYTGAAVVLPTTATMDDGTTQTALTQTTDYTVTGYKASDKTALTSAPIAAGNYYATIQGNGIYTGTADAAFTIDQADFTPPSVISIAAVTAQTYTGSEIKPTPTVTFAGTQLVPGTDFDYSYANNTNAALSTATPAPTVTINGKGNFKGTNSVTFTIDPKSVVGLEVNVSGTYTYTGSAIEPTNIEVKDGSKTLTVGTDYNITSYSNNTNAADANDPTAPPTVTITGIGNYTNSTSGTFTILDRTPAIAFAAGRTYKTFYDANETFRVPDDVTAYVVTGVSGSSVTLRRVYYISAGNPVLLESTPGVTTTVDKTETYADNYLRYGTGAAQPKHYVLYNNEFVKATGDLTNKVYLDATTLIAGARTLTIDRNNSATAIEAIVEEAADGEQWYDMQGRKINKPTKDGLYIKNGKKVVVNNK